MYKCSVIGENTGSGYKTVDFCRSDFLQAKAEVMEELAKPEYTGACITTNFWGKDHEPDKDRIFFKNEAGAIICTSYNLWAKHYGA